MAALVFGADHMLLAALVSGVLLGLLGLRPLKLALGVLVGVGFGVLLEALEAGLKPASVAAAVAIVYRLTAAAGYRTRHGRGGPGGRAALRRPV